VSSTSAADQLIEATNGDNFARANLNGRHVTNGPWVAGGAVIWGTTWRDEPNFTGIGDPPAVARLFAEVHDEIPDAKRASLPRGWLDHLSRSIPVTNRTDWDWFWTADPPPVAYPAEAQARWLTQADHGDVQALLTAASPQTSTWPSDSRARRWAGIVDADDRLAAVLADTSKTAQIAHISSVATDPRHRRRGYGAALTAWITREFLHEGAEIVTLGMYADNDVARRMYERQGYTCSHRFSSVLLDTTA
jgi:ribosomal protein S18 acetylase RimI-like enzyme